MNLFHDFKSEIKLFLIVVAVSVVLAVGGILLLRETRVLPSASLPVDQEVTLTGIIIDQRTDCYVDGVCSFTVDSERGRIEVISTIGWTCLHDAFFEGDSVGVGSTVEVFGMVESADTISACSAPEYYIKSADFEPLYTIDNQQPTIDTSDWQTYRNDEFGFAVKYPSELVQFEYSTLSINFIPQEYAEEYEIQEGRGPFPTITISTHNFVTIPGDTTRTLIERQSCTLSDPERCPRQLTFYGVGDMQDVRIGDFEALQFDDLNANGQTRHTIIPQGEGGLLFDIQNRNIEFGKISEETYTNLLSTFRFVE